MLKSLASVALLLLAASCASVEEAPPPPTPTPVIAIPAPVPPPAPVALTYNGLGVIGPAPTANSATQRADLAISRGPWTAERIAQALADDAVDPWKAFSSVMGVDFTAENYPATAALLKQVLAVAGPAIGQTKGNVFRKRPFVLNPRAPVCITPEAAKHLGESSSYPSGHTTLGWAWALALAEVAPEKADALLHRGWEYGQSRIVCGVHWASDVAAGYTLGGAAVGRMHGDPGTRALFDAARAEIAAKSAP